MAITISANADMVKGLFSQSSMFSSTDMLGISYTDYASIKSGSYHKLLSAYYSLNKTDESTGTANKTENTASEDKTSGTTNAGAGISTNTSTSASTSTSKAAAEKLAAISSGAEKVKEAADTLLTQGSESVFNKTAVKDAQGNTVTDYNKDKIYTSVKNFAEQYNTMMTNASDTNVSSIKSTVSALKNQTKMYAEKLASVGITINEKDNTLNIDEETFKNADMSQVKALFNGTNSYAYQVAEQASNINKYAEHEASRANTYTSSGTYSANSNVGEILNSLI